MAEIPRQPLHFKVKEQSLGNILELLLLPMGLDMKIEGNVIIIFKPRRIPAGKTDR